jgi:hypothetical protein
MKKSPFYLAALLFGFAAIKAPAQGVLYEGFDYRGRELDGSDGGSGGWTAEWRKSVSGGVVLEKPSLDYTDSSGKRLEVFGARAEMISAQTAGSYRDFELSGFGEGTPKVLWISFLAQVEGAPFEASGDEVSLHLRDADNQTILAVGVLGKLNLWRVKAQGSGQPQFSPGAANHPPEESSWIVARLSVDPAEGGAGSAFLWVNPGLQEEPSREAASVSIKDIEGWDDGLFARLQRLRMGSSDSGIGQEKKFVFDEFRLGTTFRAVAPLSEP